MSCLDDGFHHCIKCDNSFADEDEAIERLTRERDEARAETAQAKEALKAVSDDVAVMQTSRHDDAVDACAKHAFSIIETALADTSALDWLAERLAAARDAALEEAAEAAYAGSLWASVTIRDLKRGGK